MRQGVALTGIPAACLILALALAGGVSAHAEYVGSNPPANAILPGPPDAVSVTLSEAVQPGTAAIRVTNASGARFDRPPVSLSPDGRTISVALVPVGPAVYTVAWSVISAVDGHFTAGSFSFAVQNPDGTLPGPLPFSGPTSSGAPISPVEVAMRYLGFAGLALAFGGTVLARFVWIPAGRDPDARGPISYRATLRILLHWGRTGAFVFAFATLGLWIQATGLERDPGAGGLPSSPYIVSLAMRLSLGALLFVVLAVSFARMRDGSADVVRCPLEGAFLLSLAAIIAWSSGTHAAASPTLAAVGVAADAAHLTGVALWIGGLAGIVAARSFLKEQEALPLARYVFAGFSRLAGYGVALILGGGIVLAVLLVGSWDALIDTSYGWVVLAKVSLFAPMVAIGAYNRYWLLPKTAEADRVHESVGVLARNVRTETLIGLAVLGVAALLSSMTPAASLLAGGSQVFTLTATTEGIRVELQVVPYPSTAGVYTFSVLLWNATSGAPYEGGRNGTLTFMLLNSTLPTQEANLTGPHGNHYFVTTPALSQPGVWRIDARFSRVDGFDLRATFHVLLSDT